VGGEEKGRGRGRERYGWEKKEGGRETEIDYKQLAFVVVGVAGLKSSGQAARLRIQKRDDVVVLKFKAHLSVFQETHLHCGG
jgi:hypothetical protein